MSTKPAGPVKKAPAAPATGLGRLRYEKSDAKTGGWLLAFGAGTIALGAGVSGPGPGDREFGILCALAGLSMIGFGLFKCLTRLRCHERGVVLRSPLGEKQLLFQDADHVTFLETVYVTEEGAAVGSGTDIKITVASESRGLSLTFKMFSDPGRSRDLEEVRRAVTEAVAGKLRARLARGGEVPWSGNAFLSPAGVRYREKSLPGASAREGRLPFAEIEGYEFEQGALQLYRRGREDPELAVFAGGDNFYPGLLLFEEQMEAAQAQAN